MFSKNFNLQKVYYKVLDDPEEETKAVDPFMLKALIAELEEGNQEMPTKLTRKITLHSALRELKGTGEGDSQSESIYLSNIDSDINYVILKDKSGKLSKIVNHTIQTTCDEGGHITFQSESATDNNDDFFSIL